MRTFIKNGTVYDGSGDKCYKKNILITDDEIVGITDQHQVSADLEIDASGLLVTPGFIDTHRHCDLAALYSSDFGEIELAQGLTTIIGGNCGMAPIPSVGKYKKEVLDFIEPCLGKAPTTFSMEDFDSYMKALEEKSLALNVGSYIGIGSLKASIKGYGKGDFTLLEMEKAKTYIKDGLEAGAVGISMGIMYQPECYTSRDELIKLASAASYYNRPLTCHIRGEGNSLISSVKEVIDIARRAEVPLNISHFKSTGIKNWGTTIYEAINIVEIAKNKGQDITVDFYPYDGGSTTLISLIPPKIIEETIEKTIRKLDSKLGRESLLKEIYIEHIGWDNMVTAIGWERILISSVNKEWNKKYSGSSFENAAERAGYEDPAIFMCDLLIEEEGKVGIIVLSMSQNDIDAVAKLPYSMVISDALYGVSDSPHPRLYGSFPKIIREYVLERKVLSMEEAIRKMTSLPASRLSLPRRGKICEGYYGDINLFQANSLMDHAAYSHPKRLCTGIKASIVNGEIVIADEEFKRRNCGKVIRL